MSHFDEWMDSGYFKRKHVRGIYRAGFGSYGSAHKLSPQEVRDRLEAEGLPRKAINTFIEGVFAPSELTPDYSI